MARNEAEREDLIREAVALGERAELRVVGFDGLITIGLRNDSAMSVFIDQDPVYQFDSLGRLRRAFVGGFLYRSQYETLARLQRVRTDSQTQLLRHDLVTEELESFRLAMLGALQKIAQSIQAGSTEVLRQVPVEQDLLPKIAGSLNAVLENVDWLSVAIRRRK